MKNLSLKRLSEKGYYSRDIKEIEDFLLIYFMMTPYIKDYISEDNEDIRMVFIDTIEGQFEHDLYNKSSSNQLESDETDIVQQRIEWWMVVAGRGRPNLTMVMVIALPNC